MRITMMFIAAIACALSVRAQQRIIEKHVEIQPSPQELELSNLLKATQKESRLFINDKTVNISKSQLSENLNYSSNRDLIDLIKEGKPRELERKIEGDYTAARASFTKTGTLRLTRISDKKQIGISDLSLNNITCYEVTENYTLLQNTSNMEFVYANKYIYMFDDVSNDFVGSVNYISSNVRGFKSEFKFIDLDETYLNSKGLSYKLSDSKQEAERTIAAHDNFLSIFPNPSRSAVTFNYFLKDNYEVSILICDLNSRLVKTVVDNEPQTVGWHNKKLVDANLAAGTYFVTLSLPGTSVRSTFIIQ